MTLVELLVVIAIVSMLAGILLPVVQRARDAARKTTCESNLRQIGVAISGYEMSQRRLPYGCLEWRATAKSKNRQYAWSATILPHLDNATLAAQIDFSKPFDDPANAVAAKTLLSVYVCPTVKRTRQVRGPTDYGGLYGQRLTTKRNTNNGVFIYDHSFRNTDVIDGYANTMCVAEDSAGPDAEWINGRNVFEQSAGINDPRVWSGDNEIRSLHTGGAEVLFLDGSVRFLSQETDLATLAAFITRAGRDLAK